MNGERATLTLFHDWGATLFVIACASAYYLLNAPILLGHYDLGWHLAAGDLIRAQGGIPSHDPWSFTAGDQPWFNLSWLWDVLASALFQHAGFGGLLLLVVFCGAAIAGYLTRICRSLGASPLAVSISVLSVAVLYPAFTSFPNIYLAASPNLATMVFSVLFYGECLRPTRRLFLLPAIMLFWANLHGGFLLGIFTVGVFCGMALLQRDRARFRTYALIAGLCATLTLINPLGWHIYQGTSATLGNLVQTEITEWWPYYRNIHMPGSIPGMAYILIFAALEFSDPRLRPLEARLLSWMFLFLGFYQFRYMAFFFLFSAIPFALHLDRRWGTRVDRVRIGKALLAGGIVLACALPLLYLRAKPTLGLPPMVSEKDARYLEAHFPHARLLNHWNYGGILIFRTRGAVPIFVDGRAATAYPQSLLRDYFKLGRQHVDPAAWDAVLAKYHIDTVLWIKAHQAVRQFLVGQRGWKEAYSGAYASIYVKPAKNLVTQESR